MLQIVDLLANRHFPFTSTSRRLSSEKLQKPEKPHMHGLEF